MRISLLCAALLLITSPLFAETPPAAQQTSVLVTLKMLDTNAPAAGIKVDWHASGNLKGSGVTSPAGEFRITGLPTQSHWIGVSVNDAGLVPINAYLTNKDRLDATTPSALPPIELFVEKGTRISGQAVDETGKPIAGAKIFIDVHKKYPNPNQYVDLRWKSVATDATGHWSFDGVPANPDRLEVGGYDILHLVDDDFFLNEYKPRTALYDGSAKLTFKSGIPLEITVVTPDGAPAPGASVFYGRAHQIVDRIYPVKAGADGKVTFAFKPKLSGLLTARLAGYGPVEQSFSIENSPKQITLKLPPATPRTMDVLDRAGKPVPGAYVYVDRWNNSETLDIAMDCDPAGRVVWKDGPADGVHVHVQAFGYTGKELIWPGDETTRVVLEKETVVTASVIDAKTNAPISNYSIRTGVAWHKGDRLLFQGYDWIDSTTKRSPGKFVASLSYPAFQYLLRVQADGYLPEDTPLFELDGAPKSFCFKLSPSAPITAKVVTDDGNPVANADVYLATPGDYMRIYSGEMPDYDKRMHLRAATDAAGVFSLPPQKTDFAIAILSKQGGALIKSDDLHSDIHIQPWASVRGTIKAGGLPAAEAQIFGSSQNIILSDGTPAIVQDYQFVTGSAGQFSLPRVFPGKLLLARYVPNHAPGRGWRIGAGAIDIHPGDNLDVKLGEGLSVAGQLSIPPGKPWMIRQAHIEKKNQPHLDGWENVEVLDDGRFRAAGLEAGEYTMHVALHEFPPNNSCGWGRVVGEYDATITLSSASLDLGTIQRTPTTDVQLAAGDPAPNFSVKTLDGKTVALADHKGKFVLVDFWATWCAPCVAEIDNLKSIAAAHRSDPRFTMLSLSLDEKQSDVQRQVTYAGLDWPQAWVGVDSAPVKSWGATAIPATFLIAPDGKILTRDLRGDDLKKAIDDALRK